MKSTIRNRWQTIAATSVIAFVAAGSLQAATVAYYRFEEGTAGADVNPTGSSVVDSAGADDPLKAFGTVQAATYRATVPTATIPNTGASNTLSLEFDGNDDLYTAVSGPLVTGAFSDFTVEAYVNFSNLAGFQTIVGRDDSGNPGQGAGAQSLFYLTKAGTTNAFRVELVTSTGTNVQVNSSSIAAVNTWYHIAAVGNATAGTLELFVNGSSVGSTLGYTGLFNPDPDTIWTVGRGQFAGTIGDFVIGNIDEVRFSDTALGTSEFLNAIPEPSAALLGAIGCLALLRRRR